MHISSIFSLLLKIIPIHLFYEVGAGGGDAEVVVNHVLDELGAVDENDLDVGDEI